MSSSSSSTICIAMIASSVKVIRAVGLEVLHLTVRHRERVILVVNGARRSHGSGAVILRARLSARSAALKIWPMARTFASRAHPRRPPTMRSLDPR